MEEESSFFFFFLDGKESSLINDLFFFFGCKWPIWEFIKSCFIYMYVDGNGFGVSNFPKIKNKWAALNFNIEYLYVFEWEWIWCFNIELLFMRFLQLISDFGNIDML